MKKTIFLCLFFIISNLSAQNAQDIIDGLKKELKNNPDDKKRASIYSDLTWYYSNVAIDSALHYGKKAIIESTKLGDSTLIAQVYSDVGAVYFRNTDFAKSKENYIKANLIRKAKKDYAGVAKINANLANIYLNTKEFEKAMAKFLESLAYFERTKDYNNISVTKSNIGQLFTNLRDYPNAIKYLTQAIEYSKTNNQKDRLCEQYLNLARAYEHLNELEKAEFFYKKSITNCNAVGNKKGMAIDYQGLAIINSKKNKDSLSHINLKLSEGLKNQVNSQTDKANLKLSFVRNLIKGKKFEEAKTTLLVIKKVFENQKSEEDLLFTYKYLIAVYANQKQSDSTVFYTEKYTTLNEKFLTTAVLKQTAELEAKYQTAKKEKLLIQSKADAKQKTSLLILISFLAFFIAVVGYLFFRQQRLKNAQQEQEHKLNSAIAKIETQNKLQEQRLSISRDLHDNIGAQLTFIISSVDNIKYAFDIQNPKLDTKLDSISGFTKSTIIELRDTIWAMNSNEISYEDLEARINNFIEKAKEVKEEISFSFAIDKSLKNIKLTSVQGMNIYRTIQEAINNSLKYANATIIAINVKKINATTKITIQDNGSGFDQAVIEKGNGLLNMKKRIEEIQGKFDLTSSNEGTKIEILI